ncbi:MAG: hypothetical protein IH836_09815 [Proteobacteria bacterium]|nr:hypothetical protein [Pseudomonadota bacterium]
MHRQRITDLVLFSSICLITYLIYLPGLDGSFVLDDYGSIVKNKQIHVESFTPADLSQLFVGADKQIHILSSRPVAMLSFAINYFIGGLEPYGFKLVNLLIHLFTAWTIFLIMSWIFRTDRLLDNNIYHPVKPDYSRWLALLTAVIWVLHPLNVSTVLYSVQRMTQLSALFTLLGFAAYLKCRLSQFENAQATGHLALFTGLFICWPLGMLSKENAVILPLLCLVAEITLFRFVAMSTLLRRLYQILGLSIFATVVYFLYNPDFILSTYQNQDFTLGQRLMTESRVLWTYVHSLLLPDLARMGLYLDDFSLSTGLLHPVSTLLSIIAWGVIFLTAIILRHRVPILSFSILWFLVGHIIESSFLGLEIAFEHRNYLPGIGVILGMSWCALTLYQQQEKLRPIFRLTGIFILILLITLTLIRNHQWSTAWEHIETETRHHPLSYRANDKLAKELMKVGKFSEAGVVLQKIKYTERPFADHYFKLLITKHIANQGVSEAFYREMEDALASQRVHGSILSEFVLYLSNADTYDWPDTQRSIVFADALSRNPFLQSNHSKGKLSLALAKLYADIGDYPLLLRHMEIAHKQFPADKDLAKLYDDVISNKIQRIEIVPY